MSAQDSEEVQSLITEGIKYHDARDYDNAIKTYKKALDISPNSYKANYELGLTYIYTKDYKNALKYTNVAITIIPDNTQALLTYINKGSILNYMGKVAESLTVFEEAEKKYGAHSMLYFNWGIVYFYDKQYANAAEKFEKGVSGNYKHASGHLCLGYSHVNMNNKVRALLSFYFFMALEPRSQRSANAMDHIQYLFNKNVTQQSEKEVTITMNPIDETSEFASTEMIIPLIVAAGKDVKNKDKTKNQIFVENTKTFISSLKETADSMGADAKYSIWWNLYASFLIDMLKAEQTETFCNYIYAATNEDARDWLQKNANKLDNFKEWLKERLE